jgi:hypothetical protein
MERIAVMKITEMQAKIVEPKGTSEGWVARRREAKRYAGAVMMTLEERRSASGRENGEIACLHSAVEEPRNRGNDGVASGVEGGVFAATEAGGKDEAGAGKEIRVGPASVFTVG